ncbi:MAG TPA: glycosyltransferase [Caulobacteraceae bacterium]|jgi:glycosyltransferase involved in cell wall biosynthesis|nr:glycosyltransferase [Caulobacteraceae bacterium]
MAKIIIADATGHYDGRALETEALGGTESTVILTARGLARRGHDVTVHSHCDAELTHEGVRWRPLSARPDDACDVYVAVHQPELLGFVPRPKRRVIWVLWGANQLRHYKKLWRMWLHPPKPILMSQIQVRDYWPVLPRRGDISLIHLPLPDAVRGHPPLPVPPPRRAIFASNPQRNLRALVELWGERILPALPDAVLDVYGVNNLKPGEDAWDVWAGTLLPPSASPALKASVRVHRPVPKAELIAAMRGARAMLYLGHKCEAFCLSLAEAQALGTPAVIAPVASLPERVIDGVTGFHRADSAAFAEAAIQLLTDDDLWRRQHLAALERQQGLSVDDYVARFEAAILGRPLGDLASAA